VFGISILTAGECPKGVRSFVAVEKSAHRGSTIPILHGSTGQRDLDAELPLCCGLRPSTRSHLNIHARGIVGVLVFSFSAISR